MDLIIDLAPGAEENVLAVEIAERIRQNLARKPALAADFRALRATVQMVAQDLAESFTLRFDHGRLTVHDGGVGIPWVTFLADADVLRRLSEVPLTSWLRLPALGPFSPDGRKTWRLLADLLSRSDFKVYGAVAHPRTLVHLLRLLSSS